MKITDAKVIICSPGRNFVTLKITTEDGIYGLGDATVNGRELAVASYLSDHVIPILIGRDARRIEDIWQYLYKEIGRASCSGKSVDMGGRSIDKEKKRKEQRTTCKRSEDMKTNISDKR